MIPVALYFLYLFLATVTCQGFAGCRESNFLYNGECQPCPEHCHTCISNTNCTKCVDIYYGVICQHECPNEQDCQCHKTHGYCTFGCPDGRYPEEGSGMCPPCPVNCELCSSLTDCFVCKPGFHGGTCEEVCPKSCETCDITTGNCTVCEDGYFNQNGECQRCQDGCVSCYDYKNCSLCEEGYLELNDGQCIGNCSMIRNASYPGHGKQEDMYTLYERRTAMCDCGTGILKTKQTCIDYLTCPSTFLCPVVGGDSLQCGEIKTYACTHSCNSVNGSWCRATCGDIQRVLYFCLTAKGVFSVNDISTTSECVPVNKTTEEKDSHHARLLVATTIFMAFITATTIGMLVYVHYRRYKHRRKKQQAFDNVVPLTESRVISSEN